MFGGSRIQEKAAYWEWKTLSSSHGSNATNSLGKPCRGSDGWLTHGTGRKRPVVSRPQAAASGLARRKDSPFVAAPKQQGSGAREAALEN